MLNRWTNVEWMDPNVQEDAREEHAKDKLVARNAAFHKEVLPLLYISPA